MLKGAPDAQWLIEVTANTGLEGDHDRRLAEQRLALLRRYLERLGVNLETITFMADGERQAPVVVYFRTGEASNSEVLKE